MSEELNNNHPRDKPTLANAVIFRAKATLLQINRAADNFLRNEIARFSIHHRLSDEAVIGESRTRLWTSEEDSEKHLLAGKVHNLRLALRRLNGVEIPGGGVFSFWAQVGRASRWKGYVAGRELREGCIIPTIGGGLCQLSNALYDAALNAGFEIVERHAHTQVIPGSLAEAGRDATVFWNYVDLRFKSSSPFRIEAMMDRNFLIVRFRSNVTHHTLVKDAEKKIMIAAASTEPQSCVTCNVNDCFRHAGHKATSFSRSAYLLDEYYSEFDGYVVETRRERDLLAIPIDGKRFGKRNYAWSTQGFEQVRQRRVVTLFRAYQSRKLVAQPATRQRALLAYSERLARSYSALLKYDLTHVTVAQNLLPFLWREGYLGGRTFDVLMTATPLAQLHERLDAAFALHADSKTLADFRAPEWLVRAESEALQQARRIITPHSEIASLYRDKTKLLDWAMPARAKKPLSKRAATDRPKIAFPAPTVGRKGAYELRAAIQGLDLQLVTVGAQLEGADFWRGTSIEHRAGSDDWLEGVDIVVLPAFVEHKPRRLLEAVASGTPVIASTACGLEHLKQVINVPVGDVEALREAIVKASSFISHTQDDALTFE
jgi:VanW like protein/Glycosyl transferases group 1